jgi:hypothetical protein
MLASSSRSTKTVGFWAAVAATFFSSTYVLLQIAEWLGWLGSAGGPHSASTPLGIVLLLTPSILLGSSFLLLLVSLHEVTAPDRRVWSRAALAFGTVYAVLISMTYFVQLTFVGPRIAEGRVAGIEPFLFAPFDSFFYSVDLLGYSFMSLAMLFAAQVLTGHGLERVGRWCFLATGMLVPFLVGQLYLPWLIWPAALWAVTFPAATAVLAVLFGRLNVDARAESPVEAFT